MHISELILIALGLSMDAFAVSLSNGMVIPDLRLRDALKFGLFFGFFQMLMPLIGWLAGRMFSTYIATFDHWVAFILLGYIGIKMIIEAKNKEEAQGNTHFRIMLVLAIATSIDALAAGITFAFMPINIWVSIFAIGAITFFLSTVGALLGKKAGAALGHHAQVGGGILLVAMGFKILIEHLFF
ncbi:MAG: manganese efflux pump [Ruminococcaceae bacterium]|nr:manganese efflux pump [Oscillospiraceae bacterium]